MPRSAQKAFAARSSARTWASITGSPTARHVPSPGSRRSTVSHMPVWMTATSIGWRRRAPPPSWSRDRRRTRRARTSPRGTAARPAGRRRSRRAPRSTTTWSCPDRSPYAVRPDAGADGGRVAEHADPRWWEGSQRRRGRRRRRHAAAVVGGDRCSPERRPHCSPWIDGGADVVRSCSVPSRSVPGTSSDAPTRAKTAP